MPHLYISEPVHTDVLDAARSRHTVYLGYGPDALTWPQVAPTTEAVMLRGLPFDATMINAAPQLRIIARHGAGVDTVDVAAATAAGVLVTNVPAGNSQAVAEHTLALMLTLTRRTAAADAQLRHTGWPTNKTHLVGTELAERTLGLIGFGAIGQAVSRLATGFGMTVVAADPAMNPDDATALGVRQVELDKLLEISDVVSLHAPLLPATEGLINHDAITRLKPTAILINTSRAGLVDEPALARALREGRLAGAALDVGDAEQTPDQPVTLGGFALHDVPNLVLTPHIGAQTDEALLRVGMTALHDLDAALQGKTPEHPINPTVLDTWRS